MKDQIDSLHKFWKLLNVHLFAQDLNPASSTGSVPLTSVEGLQPLKINPSLTLS